MHLLNKYKDAITGFCTINSYSSSKAVKSNTQVLNSPASKKHAYSEVLHFTIKVSKEVLKKSNHSISYTGSDLEHSHQ